jgi:hypothetical protein
MALDLPPELTRRSEWWEERRAERAAMRAEVKEARRHGLDARHATKLIRLERSWFTTSVGAAGAAVSAVAHDAPVDVAPSRSSASRRPTDATGVASGPLSVSPVEAGDIVERTPAPTSVPAAVPAAVPAVAAAASRATVASPAVTARRYEPATDPSADVATVLQDRTTRRPETATSSSPATQAGMTGEADTAAVEANTTAEAGAVVETGAGVETGESRTPHVTGDAATVVDDATGDDATAVGSDTPRGMAGLPSVERTSRPNTATARLDPTATGRGPPACDLVTRRGQRPTDNNMTAGGARRVGAHGFVEPWPTGEGTIADRAGPARPIAGSTVV